LILLASLLLRASIPLDACAAAISARHSGRINITSLWTI